MTERDAPMIDSIRQNRVVKWIIGRRWLLFFILMLVLISVNLPMGLNRELSGLVQERTVWGLPEDAVCLYPDRNLNITGYTVEGDLFTPENGDPQIEIPLGDEAAQYLLMDFGKPVKDNTLVEVYYDEKTGLLSEAQKIESTVSRGESQLMVSLPSPNNGIVRLDINGEVTLKGIYYSNIGFVEGKETIPTGKGKTLSVIAPCVLFFVAILLSMAMALFVENPSRKPIPYVITAVCRVWLGITAGVWYPQGQVYDDALIFHYSKFTTYFANLEVQSRDVMLKELGMPIILNIVNVLGISYTMFLSLLWVLDAFLAALLVRRIGHGKRPKMEFLAFLFTLFQPIALELWTGTRLYRNALLTPMCFLVFLMGLIILYNLMEGTDTRLREALLLSIPLGNIFSLTYLIKEDGLWLLLSLVVLFLIILCVAIYKMVNRQLIGGNRIRFCALIILPFLIFWGSITLVKQANYNAFGVYATNARTAGEEGKFVTYVYRTASENRNLDVWAPADAIDKVFKASKTLKKNKKLKKAVFKTPWYGRSIKKNPIQGDFLTWVLKDALFDSGTCQTKAEAEQYLKKVNQELEKAFRKGTIKADPRFRLVSSLGGISKEEVPELLKMTLTGYKDMLSSSIYNPGAIIQENCTDDTQYASIMANQDLNTVSSEDAVKYRRYEVAVANSIIRTLFRIYDFIHPVAFALGIFAGCMAVWIIIGSFQKRTLELTRLIKALLVLFFMSLSFVYLFSISWFTYFLHYEYYSHFYGIGALPLIVLFEIMGCALLGDRAKKGAGALQDHNAALA